MMSEFGFFVFVDGVCDIGVGVLNLDFVVYVVF